jgi:hypothetical protein
MTSNYHIPRALLDVGRALPGLRIVPFGVSTGLADVSEPWRRAKAADLLLREYIKFVACWPTLVHSPEPDQFSMPAYVVGSLSAPPAVHISTRPRPVLGFVEV